MNRKLFILLAVIVGVVGFAWLQQETIRYRVTVTVDTPDGVSTGSSVIEYKFKRQLIVLPEGSKYSVHMRGEAVAVDLPGNQTLFALLKQDGTRDIGDLIGNTLYPHGREHGEPQRKAGDPPVTMNRYLVIGDRTLPESGYPLLVRFRDIKDPKSVEKVDPDNLAASFGKGVSLASISVEVTDDPVTMGIEKRLSWLPEIHGNQFPKKSPTA